MFAQPVLAHRLGAIGKRALLDAHPSVTTFPTIVFTAPSYEIITNSYHGGTYFEDNRRSVSRAGVDHVMRVFMRHFCSVEARTAPTPSRSAPEHGREAASRELDALAQIVCDEEVLDPRAH